MAADKLATLGRSATKWNFCRLKCADWFDFLFLTQLWRGEHTGNNMAVLTLSRQPILIERCTVQAADSDRMRALHFKRRALESCTSTDKLNTATNRRLLQSESARRPWRSFQELVIFQHTGVKGVITNSSLLSWETSPLVSVKRTTCSHWRDESHLLFFYLFSFVCLLHAARYYLVSSTYFTKHRVFIIFILKNSITTYIFEKMLTEEF